MLVHAPVNLDNLLNHFVEDDIDTGSITATVSHSKQRNISGHDGIGKNSAGEK